MYFAQGDSDNIRRMQLSAGAMGFADDGTNKADQLQKLHMLGKKDVMWRVKGSNNSASWANHQNWGTDLTFKNDIGIQGSGNAINWLYRVGKDIEVIKPGHRYRLEEYKAQHIPPKLSGYIHEDNGKGALQHEKFVYIPAGGYALLRVFGTTVDDVSPHKGAGLPAGRQQKGPMSLISHPAGLLCGIDAGTAGTSSVLFRDDAMQGWHELLRVWGTGPRVRNMYLQTERGVNPRLWMSIGADLVYMELPRIGENPLRNTTLNYTHEAVLDTSTIYMGSNELPKFFDNVNLTSRNLNTQGIEVDLLYQLDNDVGTATWIPAGSFLASPSASVPLKEGNARRIRLRLILRTNDASTPPIVDATVLEGFMRTPAKWQINLRAKSRTKQRTKKGTIDVAPKDLINWLRARANSADVVRLKSVDELLHDTDWILEPPTVLRSSVRKNPGDSEVKMNATIMLTLREATRET